MAIFKVTDSLAAGAVNTNLLAGSKFEFLARPSAVSVWATQGTAVANVQLDLTLGNVVVAEDINPNVDGASLVDRQRDLIGSGVGAPGDRIQLRARQVAGAGPDNITVLVEINELA